MASRRPSSRVWSNLPLAVALVSIAGAGWFGYHRLFARERQGQAQATARVLATTTAPRIMDAPGVEAWLRDTLERAANDLPSTQRLPYRRLLDPGDARDLPAIGSSMATLLATAPESIDPYPPAPLRIEEDSASQRLAFRTVGTVQGDSPVVVTRRRTLASGPSSLESDSFIRASAHVLHRLAQAWSSQPTTTPDLVPWLRGWHVSRLYTVSEDGTFVSLPLAADALGLSERLAREVQQCRLRAHSPAFVTTSFMFDLAYKNQDEGPYYSGIYLDIAGTGFVGTLVQPMLDAHTGLRGALAADIAFDIDLEPLLEASGETIERTLVHNIPHAPEGLWTPWSSLRSKLDVEAPAALREAVARLAEREAHEQTLAARRPIHHHVDQTTGETLFALQISQSQWLVALVPATAPILPWSDVVLIPLLFAGLLATFDLRRRRAHRRTAHTREQLAHWDRLVDSLRLPIVVVDPNDDKIVYRNVAAAHLGIAVGTVFREAVLADDPTARRIYDAVPVEGNERFRGYGTAIVTTSEGGAATNRHAVFRSIALEAPFEPLHARGRHRVALLLVLDEQADVGQLVQARVDTARQHERDRLAAILNHGVDTLARILAAELEAGDAAASTFCTWLAEYVVRRLHVTQWTLEHWGGAAPSHVVTSINGGHLVATAAAHNTVAKAVQKRPDLRARLHWNNGILADPIAGDEAPIVCARLDWPDDVMVGVPEEGVFGFVLGELFVNAFKYGRPGSRIEVFADYDPARREVELSVENVVDAPATGAPKSGRAYGGLAIVRELMRLCGWSHFAAESFDDRFRVRWRCAAVRRQKSAAD